MKEQAVIDAYLGAHQETDLGEVTGRINIIKGEDK
jgi:branched-chain amino acid transport system ATP-binding protein